jgi:hypothetical protein
VSEGEACIPNIGPNERRRRRRFGYRWLAISAALAAVLVATGVNLWWRLGLFLPLASALTGVFQSYEKT